MGTEASCQATGIRDVRHALGIALALAAAVLLLFAGSAQASRFSARGAGLRWGGLTSRKLGDRQGPLARHAAQRAVTGATGSIEGTVTEAGKHTAIEGIEVCAYQRVEGAGGGGEEEEAFFECENQRRQREI